MNNLSRHFGNDKFKKVVRFPLFLSYDLSLSFPASFKCLHISTNHVYVDAKIRQRKENIRAYYECLFTFSGVVRRTQRISKNLNIE